MTITYFSNNGFTIQPRIPNYNYYLLILMFATLSHSSVFARDLPYCGAEMLPQNYYKFDLHLSDEQ